MKNENNISAYQVAWVEFRAVKGIVTKADAKILLRSMLINSKHGTRVHEHFANMDAAKAYVGTIDTSKLTKNYEVRYCYDKQFGMANVTFKNGRSEMCIPFTEKQENEMFTI